MRRVLLATLALLALGVAGLTWVSRHSFHRVPVEEPAPWSQAALEDNTLLLQKWLQTQGFTPNREGGALRPETLPKGGLVILLTLSHPLRSGEVDALMAWMEQGGSLLVDGSAAPFNNEEGTRALFSKVGAVLMKAPGQEAANRLHTDTFHEGETPYRVERNPVWRIQVQKEDWNWVMGSDKGQVVAWKAVGDGRLILASDLACLRSRAFSELDHAAWLARLLHDVGVSPSGPAVVWSRPADMALWPWLWSRSWAFLTGLGALFLAWFWRGFLRFGAPLNPSPQGRRSLLEHLAHMGSFQWRQGGAEAMVVTCRKAVTSLAARQHPGFLQLKPDAAWAWLAQRSALDPTEVAEALDDLPGQPTETLARRLQTLLTLHRRLRGRTWKP